MRAVVNVGITLDMRARNLKPGFFQNECLAELPIEARLLFAGLWCMADREGRLEDRPKRIKMSIFPADLIDVEPLLVGLADQKLIVRYSVGTGRYIWIPRFLEHQNPHPHEKASELPAFPGEVFHDEPKAAASNDMSLHDTTRPADSLNPSSLNPESSLRESRRSQVRASRLADDFSLTPERRAVAEAEKLPADRTFAKFCDYWRAASGAKARKHDWDATWRNWCRSEADRSRAPVRTNGPPLIDAREKERGQIMDLAKIFGIDQGDDDWETFAGHVRARNNARLRALG